MYNIMTVDLEEWYHANYSDDLFDDNKTYDVRVIDNTIRLLDIFQQYGVVATFFILGQVAEKHPELIREVQRRGHNIASHGYGHQLVYKQTISEFQYDIQKSLDVIEKTVDSKIKGYRAPSWSITAESTWAWKELKTMGFTYDSSVFPIHNFLYGIPTSPRFVYKPIYNGNEIDIYEIPASTIQMLNKNIPFSGGFYFRTLPYSLITRAVDRVNAEGYPAIIYLHPREIDIHQPRLNLGFKESFIHYYGISSCEKKLSKLVASYKFTSIENFYNI